MLPRAGAAEPTQRLQKVLAAAGLGSRRACEELILTGRVEVDGRMVTELGTKVDPERQEIRVDGERIKRPPRVYYAAYKPRNVVSTNYDPAGRPRVVDLVPAAQRVFLVGRLDLHSEGLVLLTNDGELANRLLHPRYGVEKTYQVLVAGIVAPETLAQLQRGVYLAEGRARCERATLRFTHKNSTLLELVLREGRNRQVRRMLARLGHKVLELKRIAIGPIRLGHLEPGQWRPLTRAEVRQLEQAARAQRSPRGGAALAPQSTVPPERSASNQVRRATRRRRAAAQPAASRGRVLAPDDRAAGSEADW
jgi:23S rRNA pseudouridine2605 synthase